MRNGVLGVIGEVVGQVLNSSEMDEQAKCTRDQLLDKLEVRGCESVWVWVGRGGGVLEVATFEALWVLFSAHTKNPGMRLGPGVGGGREV